MQRRKFVKTAALVPVLAAASQVVAAPEHLTHTLAQKEVYEWRAYNFNFNSPVGVFESYLKTALVPALNRLGVKTVGVFRELGKSDPSTIHVLIPYPSFTVYAAAAESLLNDADYQKNAAAFLALPPDPIPQLRMDSWLMTAFTGMPQLIVPKTGSRLFELRSYEGYNDDAVRRKVQMFNLAEFPIFDRTGLHSVFFGEVIAGKDLPRLTYLLAFADMDERDKNWAAFLADADWKTLVKDPKYANSVSKINKTFLVPVDYSQLG